MTLAKITLEIEYTVQNEPFAETSCIKENLQRLDSTKLREFFPQLVLGYLKVQVTNVQASTWLGVWVTCCRPRSSRRLTLAV